ncbi:hypothetical protein QE152_g34430 [Popillia japonica]|uniref:Uncharacterized protein n=1 Tax=Popillia japonica TaxID=7064 RepID=A0AAW1ITZ8_POPJA
MPETEVTTKQVKPETEVTTKQVKNSTYPITWYTEELQQMNNLLNTVAIISEARKGDESATLYRQLKKDYARKVTQEKQRATTRYIQNAENKMKAIWSVINKCSSKSATSKDISDSLDCESINKYFSLIGEETIAMIDGPNQHPIDLMQSGYQQTEHSIFMAPVTQEEVCQIIKGLYNKTSRDVYGVSVHLLRYVGDVLISPLVILFIR